jgi:hypothetical protein
MMAATVTLGFHRVSMTRIIGAAATSAWFRIFCQPMQGGAMDNISIG